MALLASGWSVPASGTSASPKTDDVAEARALYTEGYELYKAKDYERALARFEAAYEASPNWKLRYNIAQVELQLDRYDAARSELEAYLEEGADDVPAERRRAVEKDLAALTREQADRAN
jgi:tetratricopeptide (TPR) repeat protein